MAVRPTGDDATGVAVWHDEKEHGGTIPWAGVAYQRGPDGATDDRFVVLACPEPGCGAVSAHPASGGCDPRAVQALFVAAYDRDDRAAAKRRGADAPKGRAAALARLLAECGALDGAAAFALDDDADAPPERRAAHEAREAAAQAEAATEAAAASEGEARDGARDDSRESR